MCAANSSCSHSGAILGVSAAELGFPNRPKASLTISDLGSQQMTMTTSPATEEYLQAIYTLADEGGQVIGARLAEFLGISAAAVSEMVHRLERDGLVRLDERKEVRFTERGYAAASSIVRRHRL